MTLLIQIKSAHLHRDTELIGAMSPYVVVYDTEGVELKRTGLKSGKNPVWQNENFKCMEKLKGLQFLIYDRENFQKEDDFVGRACLNFAEVKKGIPGQPVPVQLPLKYQERNAGRLNLEVVFDGVGGGIPQGMSQRTMQQPVYAPGQQIPIANWRPTGPPGFVGGPPLAQMPMQAQYIVQQPQQLVYPQPIQGSLYIQPSQPRPYPQLSQRVATPPRSNSPLQSPGPSMVELGRGQLATQNIQTLQNPAQMQRTGDYYIMPDSNRHRMEVKGGLNEIPGGAGGFR